MHGCFASLSMTTEESIAGLCCFPIAQLLRVIVCGEDALRLATNEAGNVCGEIVLQRIFIGVL